MKILQFIKPFLQDSKRRYKLYFFLCVILWLLSIILPYIVGKYMDGLLNIKDGSNVIWNTVRALVILWTLQVLFLYIRNMISIKLTSGVSYKISESITKYLLRVPISFFRETDAAYLNQRISHDAGVVSNFVISEIPGIILNIFTLICAGIIIWISNTYIFLYLCLIIPFYFLIYQVYKKPLYESNYKYSEARERYHAAVNKVLSNVKIIKLHEWYEKVNNEIHEKFSAFQDKLIENAKLGYMVGNIDSFIRYLANLGLFIFAGYQIINNMMSVGEFTMINSYSMMIISCLSSFLRFGKNYRQCVVSYDRIKELLQEEQENNGSLCLSQISQLKVQNLGFEYKKREIFKNLNFKLEKGKVYSIIGDNGSGKTTLLNILCGLEQGYKGKIEIDGYDMRTINHYNMKQRLISIVEQEPSLYFDTLKENLYMEAKNKKVNEWISFFSIDELLSKIPNGIENEISENAANFSGGEKQKLAIIRALGKDTDMVIFDEPDSALDEESCKLLSKCIQTIKQNKIVLLISHNQEMIRISDVVITL